MIISYILEIHLIYTCSRHGKIIQKSSVQLWSFFYTFLLQSSPPASCACKYSTSLGSYIICEQDVLSVRYRTVYIVNPCSIIVTSTKTSKQVDPKMKIQAFSSFLSLAGLLLLSPVSSSDETRQDFVECLASFSTNSTSMSNVFYTTNNSSYKSILDFSMNNLRFATPWTPKPSIIVTPIDESQVQQIMRKRVLGVKSTSRIISTD